jgi:sugar phosphate isomerase/epimerase
VPRIGLATLNHSPLHDGGASRWLEHLDAAAESGFDALAPDIFWLRRLEAEAVSLARLRREMETRGLACMEIAGIAVGEPEATHIEVEEQRRMAAELGAEFVNTRVTTVIDAALVERARGVAESFREVGTRVALEFSRGAHLAGVAEASALCAAIGVPVAGVTIDTWHFFLHPDGPDWAGLAALPLECFANVQLSDGVAYEEGAFRTATMDRRRLPGEGDFDLPRCLSALPAPLGDADCALVVEVLNVDERRRPIRDFARRAASNTRALLDGVLSGSRESGG